MTFNLTYEDMSKLSDDKLDECLGVFLNSLATRMNETADQPSRRSAQAEELGAVAKALAIHNCDVTIGGSP